ncbi:MAG: MFS transporter [Actinobacteria bacterium]|nr:MFS transporter [Actinomycetota bacterium]
MGPKFRAVRSVAIDISPLRDSVPYRALWIGQVVSLIGTQMRLVAVPFQVYMITGSTVAVGFVGLVEVVPLIALSIIGGSIADTFDRRKVMFVATLGLMLDSIALAVLSFRGDPALWSIYALTALGSAFEAIDRPPRAAIIPDLINENQVPAAIALRQVSFQITHIAGPAAGGLIIAAFGGPGWVHAADAATFVAVLIALHWIPGQPPHAGGPLDDEGRLSARLIKEGVSFSLRTPLISSIFVIDLIAMIFGMPRAVFPQLADETFGLGAAGLGLLYAAPSAGALIGALTTGWVKHVRRQGIAVVLAVAVWGAAIAAAGLSLFSLLLTLTFLAIAGAADVVSAVFRGTMLLEATPVNLRGRVQALNLMVVSGGPRIGDLEAGLVAGAIGAGPSVVVGGLACLVGTGVVATRVKQLRAYVAPASERLPDRPILGRSNVPSTEGPEPERDQPRR